METPVSTELHGEILVIRIDHRPVNALSHAVREGLMSALDEIERDENIKAATLICAGRTFIAGADISEFGKPPMAPITPDVMLAIGACSKPIIAALHGSVLGGGLETALSCSYRVAEAGTKLGLPEVTLGLIPGASGTQLLPRLVGVETALELIALGRPVGAESEIGSLIIDHIIPSGSYDERLEEALSFAHTVVDDGAKIRQLASTVLDKQDDHDEVFSKWRQTMHKKKRGLLAAQACIDSIENAVLLPFAEGIAEERRLFQECRQSSQSKAMRHAFFAERASAKVDGFDKNIEALTVDKVGVIGAGTMGVGIAMCFADAGIPVTLVEMEQDRVELGLSNIRKNYDRSVSQGRLSQTQSDSTFALISGTTDYVDLADVDLVVEAAFESMEVKSQIFSTLDSVCKPTTILASNTSYLDLDRIAEVTQRKDKVVGLHFFSPANIMKLLEIVRSQYTSDQTLATAIAVGKRIRKVLVTVGVCYGFVGNRMYASYQSEAQQLLLEGATPEDVDSAIKEWGMAMGPLEVVDLTGLDIGYKARKHQPNLPDDPSYFAAQTVLVEAGRLGQKTGEGFYKYEDGKRQVDDLALAMIRETSAKLGIEQKQVDAQTIQHRLISALVKEGREILKEGIAQRSSDIDVIWLNGYGFPRHKGGPMWYAEEVGL